MHSRCKKLIQAADEILEYIQRPDLYAEMTQEEREEALPDENLMYVLHRLTDIMEPVQQLVAYAYQLQTQGKATIRPPWITKQTKEPEQ